MKKITFIIILLFIINNCMAQVTKSFTFDGLSRTYITYVPTTYTASKKYPLVFVLHGLTQNGSGIMNYSNFNAIAEANQFIAVYPTGTGFPTSWNANISATGVNDFGFINALCDTLEKNYSIQTNRIYSCGFSNGGFLSHMLACQSTRFAAIAAVSGTMTPVTYAACNPSKNIPILQIHGDADAVVNYNGGAGVNISVADVLAFWNTKNACPTTPTTTALPDVNTTDGSTVDSINYAPCANNTRVQHLKINNGGHQWPNAAGLSGIGTINKDINAAQSIWNFFNAVTPNAISTISKSQLMITPNPVQDYLQIIGLENCNLLVYNLQGQLLLQANNANGIHVASLACGNYFLQVRDCKKGKLQNLIFGKL